MSGVTEQRITYSVEIEAPQAQCYETLIHFEDYPRFIPQIRSIAQKGDEGVWEWKIQGPGNQDIQWDVKMDALRHQNNVISWHTIRNADIAHSGAIKLKPVSQQRTRLDFVVEFQPKIGRLQNEQGIQTIRQAVAQAIEHFKQHLEGQRSVNRSSIRSQEADKNKGRMDS